MPEALAREDFNRYERAQADLLRGQQEALDRITGEHRRLIDRHVELEGRFRELVGRLDALESWAQEPGSDFSKAGTRLSALESKLVIDRQAVVAGLVAEIRRDPQLRELLRGPRGPAGDDGKPGPPGDAGSTVIREQRIVG